MASKYQFIHRKKSRIHNRGVFALKDIPAGTRVVQYTGQKLLRTIARKKPNQDYLFELNKRYDIDGRNLARYINHSCDPNCESDVVRGEIWIVACKDIKKGEEVMYNYAYELEEGLKYPCRCGFEKCVGFIMDDIEWRRFQRLKKAKKIEALLTSLS